LVKDGDNADSRDISSSSDCKSSNKLPTSHYTSLPDRDKHPYDELKYVKRRGLNPLESYELLKQKTRKRERMALNKESLIMVLSRDETVQESRDINCELISSIKAKLDFIDSTFP